MNEGLDDFEGFTDRQRHLIENPDWTLVTSLSNLFNAMRLFYAAQNGQLDPKVLDSTFVLTNPDDPEDGIRVKAPTEPMPLELRIENIMMNVGAVCFLQHDEIANQVFGGQTRFTHKDEDVRATCSVIYLTRCAFAHDPLSPRWLIAPRFRDKVFNIPAIGLTFDTTDLHRQMRVLSKIGGWVGAIRLLSHCHNLVSPETANLMVLREPHE